MGCVGRVQPPSAGLQVHPDRRVPRRSMGGKAVAGRALDSALSYAANPTCHSWLIHVVPPAIMLIEVWNAWPMIIPGLDAASRMSRCTRLKLRMPPEKHCQSVQNAISNQKQKRKFDTHHHVMRHPTWGPISTSTREHRAYSTST